MIKRNLLVDDVIVSDLKKKIKQQENNATDNKSDSIKRGDRSKNFNILNFIVSLRGTQSAMTQGKKISL